MCKPTKITQTYNHEATTQTSDIVIRFDQDWQKDKEPPQIADFLDASIAKNKVCLLWDLIGVDIEHRWKSGNPRKLESYRVEFSYIISQDQHIPNELIADQFRLEWEYGEPPQLPNYLNHNKNKDLTTLFWDLVSIDREYRWKSGDYCKLESYYLPILPAAQRLNHFIPVELVTQQFEDEWKRGEHPEIKEYLNYVSEECRLILLNKLVIIDTKNHWNSGKPGILDPYIEMFPELLKPDGSIPSELVRHEKIMGLFSTLSITDSKKPICPRCNAEIDFKNASGGNCVHCGHNFFFEKIAFESVPSTIGDYQTREMAGKGNFGIVYKAWDKKLSRTVAIKLFKPDVYANDQVKERMVREARNAAQLTHQNIVQIYAIEADQALTPYFVCQFIDGCTLTNYLKQPITFVESAELMVKISNAVGYAHKNRVIHRDLKPSNIMIDHLGEPYITDFGLSRNEEDNTITRNGEILGTPEYMSPQQASGARHDYRTDIYSLGVILYRLLTGKVPFTSDTLITTLQKVIQEEPQAPSSLNSHIPNSLENICLKAMAKEPERRYASTYELAEDLNRYLAGVPTIAQQAGVFLRGWLWCRRNPRVAMLGGIVSLLLTLIAVGSTGALFFINEARDKAVESQGKAENAALEVQRHLYISDINLAKQAWDAGNIRRMRELLNRHFPNDGSKDIRGFDWFYLWRISHLEQLLLRPHADGVSSAGYSNNGKIFVSNGLERTIKVWDAYERRVINTLTPKYGRNFASTISPDSTMLAYGNGSRITLWNLEKNEEMISFRGHKDSVLSMSFSPNGELLASGSGNDDPTIKLWSLSNKQIEQVLHGHEDSILAIQFSPTGELLVSGGADNYIKLWKRQETSKKWYLWKTFESHGERVTSIAFSPDGHYFASGSYDYTIKIWNVMEMYNQSLYPISILGEHTGNVECLDYSPDGQMLASGSSNRSIKLWDLKNHSEMATIKGHEGAVRTVIFSPNGESLLSGGLDGTIRFWNIDRVNRGIEKELILQKQQKGVTGLEFSQDGRILAIGYGSPFQPGEIILWDLFKGQIIKSRQELIGGVSSIALSPSGKLIALGRYDGRIHTLNTDSLDNEHKFKGHAGRVTSISFSPDGGTLVSGGYDKSVKIWTLQGHGTTPDLKISLKQEGKVQCLAFSPNRKLMAAGGDDKTITLLGTKSYDNPMKFIHWGEGIRCLSFSPDSQTIAAGSSDASIRVRNTIKGGKAAVYRGHTQEVKSVIFSADGATLISGSSDQTIKFWDVKNGQERLTLTGIDAAIQTLALSSDGKTLAAGTVDGRVILWHAATKKDVEEYMSQVHP